MTEYWLISAPGDKTCQQTWETMNNLTSKQNSLSSNYKFHIPDLKVGTLDQLVGLSDDLGKLDAFVEQVTRKVAAYLGEVLEDQRDKLHENLMANNSQTSVDEADNTSSEGGSDTPPNTPVTPSSSSSSSHKYLRDQHYHQQYKPWKEPEKHEQESTISTAAAAAATATPTTTSTAMSPSLGQHHYERHYNQSLHSHSSGHYCHHETQNHSSNVDKKPQSNVQGASDARTQNDTSIYYSCYHTHWCAASAPSSPSPTPTPTAISPSHSFSSCCSSDEEKTKRRGSKSHLHHHHHHNTHHHHHHHNHHQQVNKKLSRATSSSSKSQADDDTDSDHDEDKSEAQEQDQDECGILPNPGDLPSYITRFQWDMAKYPIKQSLRNIADIISKQVGQIDADLKTKSTTYNNLKGSLQNLEKKQTGSLLTRNLADLVKKEHFILDSEYLATLLVIVPKSNFQDWQTYYEKLTDMIVPRSSQMITQDQEYGLFTVTLFKKVVEEFKLHAREKKFIVRDFTYNEEELTAGKNEITKLVTDKKKQFGPLVRWLKVNFSECFCAWIHVKALRVFVESVLRYGLPVNFQAILLHPHKKSTKRLRDVLNQLYAHLDSSASGAGGGNQDSVDIPGLGFGQNEYFPYVYYKINVDMVDNKV